MPEIRSLMLLALVGGSREALEAWVQRGYGDPRALSREQLRAIVADLDRFVSAQPGHDELTRFVAQLRDVFARFATMAPTPPPVRRAAHDELPLPTEIMSEEPTAKHVVTP